MFDISDLILKQAQPCLVSLVLHHLSLKFETSGEEIEPTLHLVHIYFDTATFDNVERDQKVKFQAQLGLIGGTMGLLTGFSIISGIETIYFLFRLSSTYNISKKIFFLLFRLVISLKMRKSAKANIAPQPQKKI